MKRLLPTLLLALGLLAGCATVRLVDTQVRTYATLQAVPAGASYRFERLPSQQSHGEQQARIEAMVVPLLARAGLRRDDASTQYSVQIGALTQRAPRAPWDDPMTGWGAPGRDYVVTGSGQVIYAPMMPRMESPYYQREVSLLLRDLASGQVVYETHAAHDGRWADSEAVLPAMFEAALRDFPRAPPGTRKINIEIPPAP